MEPIAKIFALQSGPCGPELMNCDQFAIAKQPVPSNYIHPDFKDVDGVVPAMGNHLVDLTGPEFQKQPFTRSWIFGAYGGRIIFYEEMVAHRTLAPAAPVLLADQAAEGLGDGRLLPDGLVPPPRRDDG